MQPVTIRLDPGLPLCWEDERTLRFGFDRAVLRITDPSATTQRLVAALAAGVRSDRVARALERTGATHAEWRAALTRFAPVLQRAPLQSNTLGPGPAAPPPCRVEVVGPEPTSGRFRRALARAGFAVTEHCEDAASVGGERSCSPAEDSLPTIIVSLERFLALPVPADRTFPAGPPRLTVRFGDRHLDVGPLASLPGDPCPSCVSLGDVDADPSLPVLASQLLGGVPASETLAAAEVAAALAGSLLRARLAGAPEPGRERLRITVRDGLPLPAIERITVSRHDECGCRLIPLSPDPLPR